MATTTVSRWALGGVAAGAGLLAASMLTIAASASAAAGDIERVTVSSSGEQGNGYSGYFTGHSISPSGQVVLFGSDSDNLVPGDTNAVGDAFVRDRLTGQTTRVSVSSTGAQGNGPSSVSQHCGAEASANGRFVVFTSLASNLVPADRNSSADGFVHDRQTGTTSRVTMSTAGIEGDDSSGACGISADGRFVMFTSAADNIVPGDTNGEQDGFMHDRETGVTIRVNVSSTGAQANANSSVKTLSADGRSVGFLSYADNLVPGDTNGTGDAFVHDVQTGTTTRVSVSSSGAEGSGLSGYYSVAVSGDGRYVAFDSWADNLVPDDTNGVSDIFVHDRRTNQTTRVSVSGAGLQGNGDSISPHISADGRYVAFESAASNLVPGDTDGNNDIFVHDRQTGQTIRASVPASGVEGNGGSGVPVLSADGRYVVFDSDASNFVPDDTNGMPDVFVKDLGGSGALPGPGACQCYSVRNAPFTQRSGVTLIDRYGIHRTDLRRPNQLCVPAEVANSGPGSPSPLDVMEYDLRNSGTFSRLDDQVVVNQFGSGTVDVLGPRAVLVPTARRPDGPPSSVIGAFLNHFLCYQVRNGTAPAVTVGIDDDFESTTVRVHRPIRLCVPANENGEHPGAEADPDGLLCYETKSTGDIGRPTVFLDNEFGPQVYQLGQRRHLCVPSVVIRVPRPPGELSVGTEAGR